MKRMKKLPALLFVLSFVAIFSLQVAQVNAQEITNALTAPITFFGIFGNIKLRDLSFFLKGPDRLKPAAGVVVTATNFFNNSIIQSTTTNSNGDYQLSVSPGLYRVDMSDSTASAFFTPPFRTVNIKGSSKEANFTGLIFPH